MVNYVIPELPGTRALLQSEGESMNFDGLLLESVRFIERNQISDVGLWRKFVEVFRLHGDGTGEAHISWRSEYWGKMMRGAAMVVKYTRDERFYRILERSVRDILTAEDENGRISGYSYEDEFDRWDLWGRKYVMLGMMYFMEICDDKDLNREMIASMCRQADYIIAHVGEGDGKKDIRVCSKNWEGLNSCSILEPMVRLYRLTGEKRYLDFSEYIISTGFIQSANLIELAYADEVAPHDYPVVKAYEMMSCFEGLLQYYCITGIEKYKTALLNFGKRILSEEISIIGCSGCTHELFDHTAVRQTQTDYKGIVQETCVTVTWMKFALAMLELSGDVAYADAIEQSFYNNYMGSFNTSRALSYDKRWDHAPQVLPFDSYSPLVSDTRGRKVAGYNFFEDKTFYGCCACIGAAGAGVIPSFALLHNNDGIVLNYYEKGHLRAVTPKGREITLTMDTAYPYDGRVTLEVGDMRGTEIFCIAFRIPAWCKDASVSINGEETAVESGYAKICREWKNGDKVVLSLHMTVRRVLPPEGAVNRDLFAGYCYGPLVLAADKRVADPDEAIDVLCDADGNVDARVVSCPEIREAHICFALPLVTDEEVRLVDYASAGKTWDETSRCAAWLYRKQS